MFFFLRRGLIRISHQTGPFPDSVPLLARKQCLA
jgi:hypothetical protein